MDFEVQGSSVYDNDFKVQDNSTYDNDFAAG